MPLRTILSSYWCAFQEYLFPAIEQDLGPLGERYQLFITVLELVRVEQQLPCCRTLRGRPPQDRAALARAFIAKAVFQIDTTRALLERLANDRALRRLCGWNRIPAIPSEATLSRAFAGFAEGELPSRLHEVLIKNTMQEQLVGHVSRDATAIVGREKPTAKPKQPAKPKRKRGRPRKGEERPKEPSRLQRQQQMTLAEMVDDLPCACAVGTKRNAKGYKESWIGYKLHIDVADGGIPLSGILTSASVHDCQVAIPLATMTAARVTNLYDLMDAAYDAAEIRAHSEPLGHVPIIDVNPRNSAARKRDLQRVVLVGDRGMLTGARIRHLSFERNYMTVSNLPYIVLWNLGLGLGEDSGRGRIDTQSTAANTIVKCARVSP